MQLWRQVLRVSGQAPTEAALAIARERETRHWTIAQWREAAAAEGREDEWPWYSADVTAAADNAVDVLLAQRDAYEKALREIADYGYEADGTANIAREALGEDSL